MKVPRVDKTRPARKKGTYIRREAKRNTLTCHKHTNTSIGKCLKYPLCDGRLLCIYYLNMLRATP